jgi:hypothetical protein
MGKIKYKRQYLVAINELIRSYEKQDHEPEECPLCEIMESRDKLQECGTCPWVVIEGDSCMILKYWAHEVSTRLKRLYKWKEIYKR